MDGTLFKPDKDGRVADTASDPGFDIRPLIGHFGPEVTWRQVFVADDYELQDIPGYGPKTVEKIRKFLGEKINFSFLELTGN